MSPCSTKPVTRPAESMASTDVGVDASPPCGPDVLVPPKAGCSETDFVMMPPEEKLKHFDSRAQAHEDRQEVHPSIGCSDELIKHSLLVVCKLFCSEDCIRIVSCRCWYCLYLHESSDTPGLPDVFHCLQSHFESFLVLTHDDIYMEHKKPYYS